MSRLKICIFALFVVASFQAYAVDKQGVTLKDIEAIESNILMPEGAYPLAEYDRYYSITEVNGVKKLVGMYLYHHTKKPGIHRIEPNSMPMMADGGCAAIDMEYDLVNKKLLRIFCHGDA
jgi:hypothetical protein